MDSLGGYDDNPFIAEFYDSVVPYRERQDVNFFVEMAQRSGGPVLELGCGTGRVLIPIAKSGIEIVGLDASPGMLSLCREKLLSESNDVQSKVLDLVQGDMRAFQLSRKFSLVTIPFIPVTSHIEPCQSRRQAEAYRTFDCFQLTGPFVFTRQVRVAASRAGS